MLLTKKHGISKRIISLLVMMSILILLIPSSVFAAGNSEFYLSASQYGTSEQIVIQFWVANDYPSSNPVSITSYTPHLNGASTQMVPTAGWNVVYLNEPYYGQYTVHLSTNGGYSWQEQIVNVIHPDQTQTKTMTWNDEYNYNLKSETATFILFSAPFSGLNISKLASVFVSLTGVAATAYTSTISSSDPGVKQGETWEWHTWSDGYYTYSRVKVWTSQGALYYDNSRSTLIDRF